MRLSLLLLFGGFAQCVLGQLNLEQIGFLNFSPNRLAGLWYHVDSFNNEYALAGTEIGMSIVDMNDPAAPKELFKVPGIKNTWREVKTWNGFAYISSEADGSGITIVDLRSLPDTIYYKVWYGDGAWSGLIRRCHALQAEDGFLYLFGGSVQKGTLVASLQDPWNPSFVKVVGAEYVHDGFVRGDTLWSSEIYAGQFSVYDIRNKLNPVLLASQSTPGRFNHNGNLSPDGKYFFTSDERPNTPMGSFDVSELDNISLLDEYYPSRKPSSEVHNVRVIGEYVVNACYGGQITVVNVKDPENLIETAWAVKGGSLIWDAIPYLPSGVIFAGSTSGGFYVFRPKWTQPARLHGRVVDALTGLPLSNASVGIKGSRNYGVSDMEGFYKAGNGVSGAYTLTARRGGYISVNIPLVELTEGATTEYDISLWPADLSFAKKGEAGFSAYPTVFNEQLNVTLPGEAGFLTLKSIDGREFFRSFAVEGETQTLFQTAQLPSGMYFLTYTAEGKEPETLELIKPN